MTCNRATWTALTFPRNLAHEVEAGRRASHTLEFQFIYVLKGWVLEITLPADFETREVK